MLQGSSILLRQNQEGNFIAALHAGDLSLIFFKHGSGERIERIGAVLDTIYFGENLTRVNTTLVKNIKAYTLAALYNAPTTISQYYASLVSHDLAQDAAGI